MARPTRRKIKFDEESVNSLFQEIYNDSYNIKAKLTRLFTKWESKVKEGGDIGALGDQIVKLLNAEAKVQDQKITLLKYLKDVVFVDKKETNTTQKEPKEIDSNRRNELIEMVRNAQKENN